MSNPNLFVPDRPTIIAALHLPPLPGSRHPDARPVSDAVEHALRNTERAVKAGVRALYIQDTADVPVAAEIQPHTLAVLSAVGYALRREFPDLALGLCMMAHGAREPLAAAQACGAQFVRLKVYVGAMVKAEGVLHGLAYEAIQYRAQIGADHVQILADVYDRTGQPLAPMPLIEEARQAAVFGRADALVLTGASFEESTGMLGKVRQAGLGVPLLLGGGATAANVRAVLAVNGGSADGVIVGSAFKAQGGWTRAGLLEEWDADRILDFMRAVREG